ncbi:MAG TPA: hypothetical protein VFC07_02040 [Verrucomicrobiae bacterium]|nr:hypothetical protein [Verrucomicrobiae bacterium]
MEKPAETTTTAKEKQSIPWMSFVVWPFVILVLYALSVGPIMLVMDKGTISFGAGAFLKKFYGPLEWAYDKTPLHKPLGLYLHLWEPKWFDKKGEPIPLSIH